MQSLQEKLDRAASAYADNLQARESIVQPASFVAKTQELTQWNNSEVCEVKTKATVKMICIMNRYAFTNKRVLRLMRIWERVRIENEMQLLVHELKTIENQYSVVTLLHLNQYCKDRMQSFFYTWLANCSTPE